MSRIQKYQNACSVHPEKAYVRMHIYVLRKQTFSCIDVKVLWSEKKQNRKGFTSPGTLDLIEMHQTYEPAKNEQIG